MTASPREASASVAAPADMAPLMARLDSTVAALGVPVHELAVGDVDRGELTRRFGYAPRGEGAPAIVIGPDTALELGHPETASCGAVLWSATAAAPVRPGRIRCVGPDLPALPVGARQPFGQVVLLAVRPDARPDPFDLDNVQYLTNRLSGYMVRSVPGRLWVRIGRSARDAGLDLAAIGRALIATYCDEIPEVVGAEVLFVTASSGAVSALAPVATEAQVLAGQHKKLVLNPDGEIECRELNCEICEEKPVCDNIRDVARRRRRQR